LVSLLHISRGKEPARDEIPTTIAAGYTLLKQISSGAFGPG